ncbi:MAG: hypothetical protein ACYCQJ_00140 [Nitrososphaerales archaeon]
MTILAYVQAVPSAIHDSQKNFSELNERLRMVHSSQALLARMVSMDEEIVAVGYSQILLEALARGASSGISLPLCDDPLVQAESMREILKSKIRIFVGENLDGPFSGAALCGAISSLYDLSLGVVDDPKQSSDLVVLVRDNGIGAFNLDVRNIEPASKKPIGRSNLIGTSVLRKETRSRSLESHNEKETSDIIARKLRRLSLGRH